MSVEIEGNAIKSGQQFVPTTVSCCSVNLLARNSHYCEVVMLDAMGGTNSQKRPVILVVSIDGEMRNICLLTSVTVDETGKSFSSVLITLRAWNQHL